MRWMLLVDTCGAQGGVAVADLEQEPRIVAERGLPGRETQERLMTAISEVLAEAGVSIAEMDVYAVVSGPGSFTGVRIGMAAVKGLAEATDRPVVAISRLAVLASIAQVQGPVRVWLDAGRGDVYEGHYDAGVCRGERMRARADVLADATESPVVYCEPVVEGAVPGGVPGGILVRAPLLSDVLRLSAVAARAGDFADRVLMDANYLRIPDAELARLAASAGTGA